ncbi:hypothetical protein GCK72_024832 [Caenorhabditis remanei]|uniref:Uncharacterized protein n=1 Tax=Caenorhabditis remanei TaxID=31234 RepID=A0A6A5G131_CAERE|nr:hypothetical protein GCK72_024832 [Caenorhabditis remanei]KAF1748365.1 hypothetical protein GCK72_024832 [Caenorhabditis remanei]
MDTWDLGVLELNTLLWGLNGDVNVLTGEWLDGELEDNTAFLVVLWAAGNGPEVVGLDEVEVTGDNLFGFLGELVLSNNVDLVETSGLDQELVFWESVGLTLHVALVLLLFLGLLELGVDGDLVLLLGSPGGGEGELNFTVWLFTELTEGRWHLWADGEKLGAESPFLGLLEDWGAANFHVPLAQTELLVADGGELGVHVVVAWSLKLEGDGVLVSLLLLDVLDHLGEILTTVLGVVLLELELLLEDLVKLDLGEFSFLEWGDGKAGNEFSWTILVLYGDLEVLFGEEPVLNGLLSEDVSTGRNLESKEVVNLLDLFGVLAPLWNGDSSLFSLNILEFRESWVTEEDNWASGEGDDRFLVLWDDNLVDKFEVSLHLGNNVDLDWNKGMEGLDSLDSLLEKWSEHSHLVNVGGSNRWASLNGQAEFSSIEFKGEFSFSRHDSWDLSGDNEWESKSGWEFADNLIEESGVVGLEIKILVKGTTNLAELDLSVADEFLNKAFDELGVDWENGIIHILVAEVDHGEGVLLVTGGWASTDVHLLGELLEKLNSGLDAASADNGGGFLLKRLELLESLVEVLVHVLLGESDLGEVLDPVSSKNGVKRGVELSVGGGNHLLLWLVAGEGENLRAILGDTFVTWVGGLSEVADHLVGKSSNLLVGLLLHLRDDLDEECLFWAGVHHSPESKHTDFWLVLTVLVDWEENLLDLAWHGILKESEGIDCFLADWEWLALVNNDLVELVDRNIESSVSDGLEGQNLLPDGLTDNLTVLGDTGVSELDEGLSNSLGWEWSLLDRLEELSDLNWSDLALFDVSEQVLNGVLGSGDGKDVLEEGLNLKIVISLLYSLRNGAGAEKTNELREEVSGLWHVVLFLLDSVNDGLDELDLLVKWELFEWLELSLVSVLEEILNKLFPAGRVDDIFLLSIDLKIFIMALFKHEFGAGLSLHDFLSVDIDGVEGANLGLLELIVFQNVGVDSLWADDFGLLLALWALRRETESVGGFGTLGALVEVDGFGDDGLLLLTDNGVGDLAFSLEGLLSGEERTVFLGGFLVFVRLKSLHLVSWGNWVEGDHVENGSLHVL